MVQVMKGRRVPTPKVGKCSASTRYALYALLALAVLFGALAAFGMPRVRENFDAGNKADGLQLVHATWCGHCKELLKQGGEWDKLKAALPGVRFVELDESTLEGKAAVKEGDVQGFPDIRAVKGRTTFKKYEGARTAAAMKAFVLENIQV